MNELLLLCRFLDLAKNFQNGSTDGRSGTLKRAEVKESVLTAKQSCVQAFTFERLRQKPPLGSGGWCAFRDSNQADKNSMNEQQSEEESQECEGGTPASRQRHVSMRGGEKTADWQRKRAKHFLKGEILTGRLCPASAVRRKRRRQQKRRGRQVSDRRGNVETRAGLSVGFFGRTCPARLRGRREELQRASDATEPGSSWMGASSRSSMRGFLMWDSGLVRGVMLFLLIRVPGPRLTSCGADTDTL